MLKPKRKSTSSSTANSPAKSQKRPGAASKARKAEPESKQSRLITLLQSSKGATIAAMMTATGWQQHSVRGFLAGVVRKRLKLKLDSKKMDGNRVYRITGEGDGKSATRQFNSRSR